MEITLGQLLASRDARAQRQRELLADAAPDRVLLCLTVIMPGPVKRSPDSLAIAAAAVEAVRGILHPVLEELRDLETGYEGYFLVPGDPIGVKREAVRIEDTHPLGRFFDLDVLTPDGPLSRTVTAAPERRCLLCERPARVCMRERRHSVTELLAAIGNSVKNYKESLGIR